MISTYVLFVVVVVVVVVVVGIKTHRKTQKNSPSLKTQLSPHLVKHKKSSNLADTLLDRSQTNQLLIKLNKLIIHSLLEHEIIHRACDSVVRHLLKVLDLGRTGLTRNFLGAVALVSRGFGFSALGVCLAQALGKVAFFDVLVVGVSVYVYISVGSGMDGLERENILLGWTRTLLHLRSSGKLKGRTGAEGGGGCLNFCQCS